MRKLLFILCVLCSFNFIANAQSFTDTWKPNQLMSTKTLADKIVQNKMKNTVVINIGPDAVIKNSFNAGPGKDNASIIAMKTYLSKVSKNNEVVLYCGCCPFNVCPNIRPAFKALTDLGFKNAKLLNIPKNIKVDWIDKKYPIN